MSLSEAALEAFVDGVREQDAGIDSRRAVQLRVVEPLLEVLGWDVRTPAVEPDVELGDARLDYVLVVSETPVVAVRTTAPDGDLEAEQTALARALGEAGIDWGVCTDGHRYVLLARSSDGVHRRRVELADLPAHRDALEPYTREVRASRATAASQERREAYRQLSERRDVAVAAATEALVEVAGEPVRGDARESAERLVAYLLENAPEPSVSSSADAGEGATASPSDAHEQSATAESGPLSVDEADAAASERSKAEAPDAATAGGTETPDAGAGTADSSDTARSSERRSGSTPARPAVPDDAEFVVRFFGGSSSVGAVGTGHPGSTLAGAVTYLYENHDLGSAVTLPWGVQDGRAVLAGAPEHPNGNAIEPHETVDGDCFVWTGAPVERTRTAIEELADAVGLRVMFQGDW